MSRNSLRSTIKCFTKALPQTYKEHEEYLKNRTVGVRPKKGGLI